MKKFYSLFLLMLFAIVGAGQAWAEEYKSGEVDLASLQEQDVIFKGVKITGISDADFLHFYDTKAAFDSDPDGYYATLDIVCVSEYIVGSDPEISEFESYVVYTNLYGEYCFIAQVEVETNPDKDRTEYVINGWGTSGGKYYSTIMLGRNWIVPDNCITYYVNENLELTTYVEGGNLIDKGNIAGKNVPLIIECTNNEPLIIYTTNDATKATANGNLLCGVLVDTPIPAEPNVKYYKLSYNASHENLGFYWDGSTNDEGATIKAKDHRAYLRVEGNSGSSNYLALRFDDTITAIEAISAENESQNIYDLWGKRTNNQNGIVIKDGKKMLVK